MSSIFLNYLLLTCDNVTHIGCKIFYNYKILEKTRVLFTRVFMWQTLVTAQNLESMPRKEPCPAPGWGNGNRTHFYDFYLLNFYRFFKASLHVHKKSDIFNNSKNSVETQNYKEVSCLTKFKANHRCFSKLNYTPVQNNYTLYFCI